MTPGERWLTATWPVVRACLPAAPARVVEVGCGPLGGFVPMLRANRYDAVGIDPRAPDDAHYQRIEFERAELPRQVDAVVASTSLHHVADPAQVIDRITNTLRSGGALVVVEWGWEKFDQQQRNGASNASDQTAKPAGSIADGTNGSPRATSGRATCAAGRSAKGCIPAMCWSACWTTGSSTGSLRTGPISLPILPAQPKTTSRRRSTPAISNRPASTT